MWWKGEKIAGYNGNEHFTELIAKEVGLTAEQLDRSAKNKLKGWIVDFCCALLYMVFSWLPSSIHNFHDVFLENVRSMTCCAVMTCYALGSKKYPG